MCLIVFAYNSHPEYSFIFAGNRDEFYSRPTKAAEFWEEAPKILAGKDLVHGGTWLGVTRNGRFAAVTNYRQPNQDNKKRSRGELVINFLRNEESPKNYLENINCFDYAGFNLLVGNLSKSELFYLSNREGKIKSLKDGIYGLSNHLLNTDWHKVRRAKEFMKKILHQKQISSDELFCLLADKVQANEHDLPDTGIGMELERILSSIFVETPIYGTRCSTVLLLRKNGELTFIERSFQPSEQERKFVFMIA
jgi:uncharacterized protein with NRDE domain